LRLPIADHGVDVVTCSLFLHHFDEPEVIMILQEACRVARRAIVVGELVRSRSAWLLTCLVTRLMSRSWIFHVDGPRSVRAAFRANELRNLAGQAGLLPVTVKRVFPFRYVMTWRRPGH
jgi:ubiquinone/menaquinone biosynthesis C-methylase UbiE